jgi:hypothetical protein
LVSDASEEDTSEGDMDHGLGAVDALLVVPRAGALDDPAAWKDFEALRGIGPFDDFDG